MSFNHCGIERSSNQTNKCD